MQIIFTKNEHKSSLLKIVRTDQTETWTKYKLPFEAQHDLMHYALETTLGYTKAFYGLINEGYDIQDFGLPRAERPTALVPKNLHQEALWTEMVVGLLQTEWVQKTPKEDFLITLELACEEKGWLFPSDITIEDLDAIRLKFEKLWAAWLSLEDGQRLELEF